MKEPKKKKDLTPWEAERRRLRLKELKKKRQFKLPIDGRKHGRALTVKRPRGIALDDIASFSCPVCQNNLKKDLVRLRQDFWECRKCRKPFIKENVIDEFDFDYGTD